MGLRAYYVYIHVQLVAVSRTHYCIIIFSFALLSTYLLTTAATVVAVEQAGFEGPLLLLKENDSCNGTDWMSG